MNSCDPINIYTDAIEGQDLTQISAGLSALLEEAQAKEIVFLVQFPSWYPVAKNLQKKFKSKIVFDCMDHHAGFSTNTGKAIETEDLLAIEADLVTVSSLALYDEYSPKNSNVVLVKNGTEYEHFQAATSNGVISKISDGIIIGYYGAISDWFDIGLSALLRFQSTGLDVCFDRLHYGL